MSLLTYFKTQVSSARWLDPALVIIGSALEAEQITQESVTRALSMP